MSEFEPKFKFEGRENEYETIRKDLEVFLPQVGEKVMELYRSASTDPDFTRLKADKTIVTKADELAEDLIRAWIQDRFPGDTIRGEEREKRQGNLRTWIIDPIDGTYNFNHFGSKFSISVGLAENNVPKIGILFYPAEDIMLSASENIGAQINGNPLTISKGKTQLKEALVVAQSIELHREYFSHPRFANAIQQQNMVPLKSLTADGPAGSFTFAFLEQLIKGSADAILHPGVTPYDIGAICAIAKELNFSVSGYEGEPIDFAKDTIPIIVSRNRALHESILAKLNA